VSKHCDLIIGECPLNSVMVPAELVIVILMRSWCCGIGQNGT
jgi:hypothetical protein